MQINPTQYNQLSNEFQNLSNLARQAGSNSPAAAPSAQYFNQLLAQMSQNLKSGGSTSGTTAPSTSTNDTKSNQLTALLGKFI
jgi:hypothetical protein